MTTLNALLREVWADIQKANRQRELDAIKANPEKHRLTRIMSAGGNTGYRYWSASIRRLSKKREDRIKFCVATHRNAAGNFLLWRQIDQYKLVKGCWSWFQTERFDFQWSTSKKELREIAARKAAKDKLEWAHECAAKLPDAPQAAKDMLAQAAIG
jgi:hypothetical protein